MPIMFFYHRYTATSAIQNVDTVAGISTADGDEYGRHRKYKKQKCHNAGKANNDVHSRPNRYAIRQTLAGELNRSYPQNGQSMSAMLGCGLTGPLLAGSGPPTSSKADIDRTPCPNSSRRGGPWQGRFVFYTTEENERHAEHNSNVCDVEHTRSQLPDAYVQKIKNPAIVDTTIEQVAEPSTQNASYRNDFGAAELGRTQKPTEQADQNRQNAIYENDIASRIRHSRPEA